MIEPKNYYAYSEFKATSLGKLKETFEALEAYAEKKNYKVYWRGQANAEWPLHSSLARRLVRVPDYDEDLFESVEKAMLKEAGSWIKALEDDTYRGKPLAQLVYLQHHGVPTRLLDFTRDPWMATFFASNEQPDKEARLFCLMVNADQVISEAPTGYSWHRFKNTTIEVLDPGPNSGLDFDRITAQKGVLVFGRLPTTTPARTGIDPALKDDQNKEGKKRAMLANETRSALSIPYKLNKATIRDGKVVQRDDAQVPIGYSIRLSIDKGTIISDLARKGGMRICPNTGPISYKTMYPDIDGMVRYSNSLKALEAGAWIIREG